MSKMYCRRCKKYTKNKNGKVSSTSNGMENLFSASWVVCNSQFNKKSRMVIK